VREIITISGGARGRRERALALPRTRKKERLKKGTEGLNGRTMQREERNGRRHCRHVSSLSFSNKEAVPRTSGNQPAGFS